MPAGSPPTEKAHVMKKLIRSLAFLCLLAGSAQAGVVLSTSNPMGSPLIMSAGSTSGSMFVNVVSDNPPNDIMAAWQFNLMIAPEAGASGTLIFQDPASGTPSNPPNYVFGSNDFGISVTNGMSQLSANDFFDPSVGVGAPVPGSPGANLLQMDFLASSNASGLFGIYALEGPANTFWNDPNFNELYFTNVPNGTGMVLIGEVLISGASVPEPSSLGLLGLAAVLGGWQCWSRRKTSPATAARPASDSTRPSL